MYIIDVCCFLGKEILRFLLSNSTRWTVFMIQFTASSSTELPHEFLLNTPTKLFENKFRKFFLIFTRLDNFRPLRLMLSCCVVLLTASRISAPLPIFFCQTVREFYIVRSWKSWEGSKKPGRTKIDKVKSPISPAAIKLRRGNYAPPCGELKWVCMSRAKKMKKIEVEE